MASNNTGFRSHCVTLAILIDPKEKDFIFYLNTETSFCYFVGEAIQELFEISKCALKTDEPFGHFQLFLKCLFAYMYEQTLNFSISYFSGTAST